MGARMSLSREERDGIDRLVAGVDWVRPAPMRVRAVWADGRGEPSGVRPVAGRLLVDWMRPDGRVEWRDAAAGQRIPLPVAPGLDGWLSDDGVLVPAGGMLVAPDPLAAGSVQRRRVCEILDSTSLILDECERVIPSDRNRMVYEFVRPRIMEKILHTPIVSNPRTWNHEGLWNPLHGGSFCGWVRQLSARMAKSCAPRVLHARARDLTSWERDDGSNPIMDRPARPVVDVSWMDGLLVPRPVGADRTRILRRVACWSGRPDRVGLAAGLLRRRGWWDASLDGVDEDRAVMLLLAGLPCGEATRDACRRLVDPDDPDARRLGDLWYRDQTGRLDGRDAADWRRLLALVAGRRGVTRWRIILTLGSRGVRLL